MKVTGPFAGHDASGSLADAITFQTTRSRQVVRKKPRPKDAKTGAQLSSRAMLTFLAAYWQVMPDVQKLTWDTEATARSTSIYNAYLGENLRRWGRNRYPGQTHPINEALSAATFFALAAPGGVHLATVTFMIFALQSNWGATIHRSQVPAFTPTRENSIGTMSASAMGGHTHVDRPLPPGTYYYKVRPFSIDGKPSALYSNEATAVVTS